MTTWSKRGRSASGIAATIRAAPYDRPVTSAPDEGGRAGSALGPIRAIPMFPGVVHETWPCDDVFTTGSDDGCRVRRRSPIG